MPWKQFFLLLLICCGLNVLALAQDKKPNDIDEVIRVDTELVDIPVVVTDKAGKAVLNLKKKNFNVYEDGKLQQVSDFAATSARLPRNCSAGASANTFSVTWSTAS